MTMLIRPLGLNHRTLRACRLTAVLLLAGGAFVGGSSAWAQGRADLPLWEVGVFGVGLSQQAYPGADQQVQRGLALPYVIYRGDWLRLDRDTAGLRALKTDSLELDVGFGGALGARGGELAARNGMPRLGTLVEFGPRLKWNLGSAPGGGSWRVDLPVRAVFDVNDGWARRGTTVEPEATFERQASGGFRYRASLSAIVGDQRLGHTFYGVTPAYALAGRPAYTARGGLISWRLATAFSRDLSPDWRLFGYARLETVHGAANASSPLVRQNTGATVGLGFTYTWMRSAERAGD